MTDTIIDQETGEILPPANALAVIENTKAENVGTLLPAIAFAPGGIDAILAKLRADVMAIETDISTDKGRKAIASLAYKVARSKTAIDGMGKQLKEDAQKVVNAVDADRKKARDELDKLAAEVRKPLDDWEAAEKTRIDAHEGMISDVTMVALSIDTMSSTDLEARQASFEKRVRGYQWQEFEKRGSDAVAKTRQALADAHGRALKREADAAELERLRAEQAAREQKDRDDRIAAEAAEKARIEAEAKAEQDALDAAEREAAERQRIIDEAKAAADAAEAERLRIEAEAAAAKERADKSERARIEAEAKAESDRIAAIEQAAIDTAAAVEAERKRQKDEADAAAKEAREREENKKHAAKIHNEMMLDIMSAVGLSETTAKAVVIALATKKIRHTGVTY